MQRIGHDGRRRLIVCAICIGILAITLVSDLLTKAYFAGIDKQTVGRLYIPVIKDFFYFTYVENPGAAFSFLHDVSWGQIFFKILTSIALVFFGFYFYYTVKKNFVWAPIALSFMIGGTIGNFVDRLAFDKVRDFIGFTFGNYNFPIFNLADSFLVVGVIMFIIHLMFFDEGALFKKSK